MQYRQLDSSPFPLFLQSDTSDTLDVDDDDTLELDSAHHTNRLSHGVSVVYTGQVNNPRTWRTGASHS